MSIILAHTTSSSLSTSAQEEVDPRAPKLLVQFCALLASKGVRVTYGTLGALFPSGRHQPGQRGAYLIHMAPKDVQWIACQKGGGYDKKAYEDWDLRQEYLQAPIMGLDLASRVLEALSR